MAYCTLAASLPGVGALSNVTKHKTSCGVLDCMAICCLAWCQKKKGKQKQSTLSPDAVLGHCPMLLKINHFFVTKIKMHLYFWYILLWWSM